MSGLEAALKAKEAEVSALRSKLPAGNAVQDILPDNDGCCVFPGQRRPPPAIRHHKVTMVYNAMARFCGKLSVPPAVLHCRRSSEASQQGGAFVLEDTILLSSLHRSPSRPSSYVSTPFVIVGCQHCRLHTAFACREAEHVCPICEVPRTGNVILSVPDSPVRVPVQAKEDDTQLRGCVAALACFLEKHDLRTGALDGELQRRSSRTRPRL